MHSKTIRPFKLLLLAPLPPPMGGISAWASYLLPYIASRQELEVVHLNSSQRLRAITNYSFMQNLWTGLAYGLLLIFRLLKKLLQSRPDVFYCQTSGELGFFRDWVFIRLAHLYRVPVVIHFHFGRCAELARKQNWEWRILRRVVSAADGVIVLDRPSMQALEAAGFKNIYLVPNPMSPALAKTACASASSSRKTSQVLFVGHIVETKGILNLAAACADLPQVEELLLIGPVEPQFKAEVAAVAQHRDAGRWLVFAGAKSSPEVLDAMRAATVLVLPSHSEAFPIVLLEALAMGCPVVATAVGAIPDILGADESQRAGICVPPRDIDALRQALKQVLENQEERARMGDFGRRKVLADYTMDRIYGLYWDVWNKVAKLKK